uniref:Uncharacterized protein n=1 Tax=Panagrolaimus davidi TaxID=227884 RepID=A0A914P2G0_9BILA
MSDLSNVSEPQLTKNLHCWNKLNKDLSYFNIQSNANYDQKKDSKTANSSTISLHIAAYEDSTEAQAVLFGGELKSEQQKSGSIKDLKNAKQCFNDFLTHNSFEFPRQQNPGGREPEISQFKKSQQLFNPNKSFPAVSNTRLTGQTGSEEKGFDEWNEVMSKDLKKLNLHCKYASHGIMGITETSDFGIVVQNVTSITGKKYFVIAELKRACVTFFQNDDTSFEYECMNAGKIVHVERNAANEIENLALSNVSDKYFNELANNDGVSIFSKS